MWAKRTLIRSGLVLFVLVVLIFSLSYLIVPHGYNQIRGSSTIVSLESNTMVDNFSTSYLSASLNTQGQRNFEGVWPFAFYALNGSIRYDIFPYAIIYANSSGGSNLTVWTYPNSSFDSPTGAFYGQNFSLDFGSTTQLPFEEISSWYDSATFSDISETSLMNGSFDPPKNYSKDSYYNQYGFYLNASDYTQNTSGTFGTGSFQVSGNGGDVGIHFCQNSNNESFTVDRTKINVTQPYLIVGGGHLGHFEFSIHFIGYSQIANFAINYLQIHSVSPPYSSLVLNSSETAIFSTNGIQENIVGNVHIDPLGVLNITTPIEPRNYIVINAPFSNITYDHNKSIFTTPHYVISEPWRIVSSLALGAVIGASVSPVFKRILKWAKQER